MDLGLNGKVALVTGASTGIGLATARCFAAEGARVVGVARHAPEEVVDSVETHVADLSIHDAPALAVTHAIERHGRLDILVNNAATGTITAGVVDEDDDAWASTLELNLMAAVRATRAAIPHMLNDGGVIVNVTSVNGRMPAHEASAYSASKAALLNFGKAVATEYAAQGIRVVTVAPGLTATPMWLGPSGVASQIAAATNGDAAAIAEATATSTPLGRFLSPDEIANCICFMASPRASAVTGAEIVVDGGLTQTM